MVSNPSRAMATVGIVTRDRGDFLKVAIDSARSQEIPVDVLVLDDGSRDGTSDMVARDYPDVTLLREATSQGYIHGRMRILREARTEIVFILDDDAFFSTPRVVEQTLADFDHPRVAVVAVPALQDGQLLQGAPGSSEFHLTNWSHGCSTAVKRSPVLKVGGLRTSLRFYAEEQDMSIRLLDQGFVTRVGRSDPIVHTPAPGRDWANRLSKMTKSVLAYKLYTTPALYVIPMITVELARAASGSLRTGWFAHYFGGIRDGFLELLRNPRRRKPVSHRTYRAWLALGRSRALPLKEIEPLLREFPVGSATDDMLPAQVQFVA